MLCSEKYVLVIKLMDGTEFDLVKDSGYKVIAISPEFTTSEVMRVDIPIKIDLNDEDCVISKIHELSNKYNIVAVFTLNEYRVQLGARIREELGIPFGISYEAASNCRNKKRTREILSCKGVNTVKYSIIHSSDEVEETLLKIPLPVVVKPSNDAGSNMVYCCQTKKEVIDAIETIKNCENNSVGQKLDKDIILEEFLTGPEFSVEAYTFGGKTEVLAITAKKVVSPFFPIEEGHTVPSRIKNEESQMITSLVEKAMLALGIDYTVTHTEVKLTPGGPKIIEVNARPGGDKIPVLVNMTKGYNLHKIALDISLGKNIEDACSEVETSGSASIRFFIADSDGVVKLGNTIEVLQSNPDVVYFNMNVEEEDRVSKTTSNYNRLGYFIVKGNNEKYSEDIAEDILNKINITVIQD
ncbi:alanine-anticapsin ligase BacD [Ruminiclostridium hungatei]|uniref:Alanine-anticapsin ligase BacD n=1 Tax=Ruminiclostridium hungatei TaxID=48256 RepID=A0A1V4SJD7_RUMHU|nr:ATP-grasp domain-containing protein [Ruminiclostridium hungatei]OPX43924.1 alanine-anticapsin ligase BacD [Ruminiclostridium hungatei]